MKYVLSKDLLSRDHSFNGIPIVTYVYDNHTYISFMEFNKGTGGNIRAAIKKSYMEHIIRIDGTASFPIYLIRSMPSWFQRVQNFMDLIMADDPIKDTATKTVFPTLVPDRVHIEVTKLVVPDGIVNLCTDIKELTYSIKERHTAQRREIDKLLKLQDQLHELVATKDQSAFTRELKYYTNFQFNDIWGVTAYIKKHYPKGLKREAFVQDLGSQCVEMSAQMDAEVRKEKIPDHLLKKYRYDNEYRGVYREDVSEIVYRRVFGDPMNQLLRKVK